MSGRLTADIFSHWG